MIYQRVRTSKGWRYKAIRTGRGIRRGDSYDEAAESAKTAQAVLDAAARGLTVAEAQDLTNAHRTPVAIAVKNFLAETSKGKIGESLKGRVRFMDEVDSATLRAFRDFLAKRGFSEKTQHNRLAICRASLIGIGPDLMRSASVAFSTSSMTSAWVAPESSRP